MKMMKRINKGIMFFICCLCGCYYQPWKARVLTVVNGPEHQYISGELPKNSEYVVNGVVFYLAVVSDSRSYETTKPPFLIVLQASSRPSKKKIIVVDKILIKSSLGQRYNLCSTNELPAELMREISRDSDSEYNDFYKIEFDENLKPHFTQEEQITITFDIVVNGVKGKLTFYLEAYIKKGLFQLVD
jgi:hypothetical protein